MRLALHYRGPLKAAKGPKHKQELRLHFAEQLEKLWSQNPLSELKEHLLDKPDSGYCLRRDVGGYPFIPLITQQMNVVAELSIIMLRPEAPGNIIAQGGDIDNRLKTLFDSLTMPTQTNSLPSDLEIDKSKPCYCLFEDDNLITSVTVRTEQLLEPNVDKNSVDMVIFVHTMVTRNTMGNQLFA